MMMIRSSVLMFFSLGCVLTAWGQQADSEHPTSAEASAGPADGGQAAATSGAAASGNPQAAPKHAQILKDAKSIDGVIQLYRTGNNLYGELTSGDYSSEFIVLISIARGIGQNPLLGGMSWSDGDDWVWSFRKIDDRVHIIRKNVRFRANKNSPEERAVRNAYTDSVLFSLPIVTKGPKGGDLVDLTPVFMSDLPQISQVLVRAFVFAANKSIWASVKGFPDNVEIEVAATYASGGQRSFDSVADSRGVTINVHYSISKLPQTGYQPRLADDRVGYFLTVVKDYSKVGENDRFVRYINRWNLKPADSSSPRSAPKQPIIFWIEKTVPFKYRKPIRDGIVEWNKAFEKAGFVNAIEVRQQPDDATGTRKTSTTTRFAGSRPARASPWDPRA